MAEIDWKKLKADSEETRNELNPNKLSQANFILFASCTAIMDHPVDDMSINAPAADHKTLVEIVEDELADAQMYADMGDKDTATDESRHALKYIRKLQESGKNVSKYADELKKIQDYIRGME